jgi:hypothetical protein
MDLIVSPLPDELDILVPQRHKGIRSRSERISFEGDVVHLAFDDGIRDQTILGDPEHAEVAQTDYFRDSQSLPRETG